MTTPGSPPGLHTQAEILAFEPAWRAALESVSSAALAQFWAAPFRELIFTGCGSAYFAGMSAAAAAQALLGDAGVRAFALPASELLLTPEARLYAGMQPILIACSRSGATSETLAAIAVFRRRFPDRPTLLITCTADSPMARSAQPGDLCIALPIREHSVVQTSSLSAMLLTVLEAVMWARHSIPADAQDDLAETCASIREQFDLMVDLGINPAFNRFFFVGGGAWRGIASEAMLKLKEMTFCQSEAFHPLELRHGLGANADDRTLLVGFLSAPSARIKAEFAVLTEFRARGAHTLAFLPGTDGLPPIADERDHRIIIGEYGPLTLVLPLPLIQYLGLKRALLVGRDPDRPENLTSFIQIDTSGLTSAAEGGRTQS